MNEQRWSIRLPGQRPRLHLYLSSTLDDIGRFPESKHACAYLGLVPWFDETADTTHLGHITKRDDKYLRKNLIECARAAIRKDQNLKHFQTRWKRKRGDKRAIIAHPTTTIDRRLSIKTT